jgi:hypothetical protein
MIQSIYALCGRLLLLMFFIQMLPGLSLAQVADSSQTKKDAANYRLIVRKDSLQAVQKAENLRMAESKKANQNSISSKDSASKRNDNTIMNLAAKKSLAMDTKLNLVGFHLHKAGRNVTAVGAIIAASVTAVILFNTTFKPKEPEDRGLVNAVYGGLGLSFLLCSIKGGYHISKAGKTLKDPRFFKQEKTIYDQ